MDYRKRNKNRARSMENRIAKKLSSDSSSGRRVPMSGSGSLKGDVMVFSEKATYLIECKLSAFERNGLAGIVVKHAWLKKIIQEAKDAPGVRFGALVIRYHGAVHADYVVIDVQDLQKYAAITYAMTDVLYCTGKSMTLYRQTLDIVLDTTKSSTASTATHTARACIIAFPQTLEALFSSDLTQYEYYAILRIDDFKHIMEEENTENTEDI